MIIVIRPITVRFIWHQMLSVALTLSRFGFFDLKELYFWGVGGGGSSTFPLTKFSYYSTIYNATWQHYYLDCDPELRTYCWCRHQVVITTLFNILFLFFFLYHQILLNPRSLERGGGGQIDPPLNFFGFKFLLLDRLSKAFGTTVPFLQTHLLTLIMWRHMWWRHRKKSRNLCVDCKISIFR